jgi:serine protein kinase
MEAFRDRTIKIDVPYNTRIADEVRIYGRRFVARELSGRSMAPHTLEIAALWAVMTRLEDPTQPSQSLLQKARLYDGREVQGFGPEHVREMHKAAEREGLFGISPRYVQDRIASALVADKPVVGPLDVLAQLEEGLVHHSLVSNEETRRRYVQLIDTAREEYEEIIKREVQEAISSDREALDRLCAKYIDNIKAYVGREKREDWNEQLMRKIEEKIDIPETRKQDFRHQVMNYLNEVERQGRTFDYREDKRLARALELCMFEDRRNTIQLTSDLSRVVDPDVQEKIAVIRTQLMRKFGYDEVAADEVLHLVAGLFARGEAKTDGPGSAEAA